MCVYLVFSVGMGSNPVGTHMDQNTNLTEKETRGNVYKMLGGCEFNWTC